MIESIRAIITEVDDAGISTFTSSDVIEPVFVQTPVKGGKERAGTLWQVWGTSDGLPAFKDAAGPALTPFFPGPGGTRFAVFSIPPDSSVTELADRQDAASGDFLGIADSHEPDGDDPAFHTTSSIDYLFIAEGELVIELDGGRRETLTPGTCLVQRGTRHAWRNLTAQRVLIVSVIVGVDGDPAP